MYLVNSALGSSRWEQLEAALRGLERTGVPLVAATGAGYGPAGFTDDPGIYYLVPRIAHATGWGLATCLERVLFGAVALSLLVGLAGLFLLFRDTRSRLHGCFALGLVSAVSLIVGGVYIFQSAVVVAATPWIVWAVRKRGPVGARFAVLAAVCYAGEGIYVALRRPPGSDPAATVASMLLMASAVLVPVVLATGTFVPLGFPWGEVEWSVVAMMAVNALAYSVFYHLIQIAGPVFATQMSYVVTIAGVAWGIAIFGEQHSLWVWGALALMLAGLALVTPRSDGGGGP